MKMQKTLSLTLVFAILAWTISLNTASAGGLLGALLFGSLDSAQSDCAAQHPGNYLGVWTCVRRAIAANRAGDMRNGPGLRYISAGDMLYAAVKSRHMDDATALYRLASELSHGDLEYSATHPDTSVYCWTSGNITNCN
jgi:hypothetical protein